MKVIIGIQTRSAFLALGLCFAAIFPWASAQTQPPVAPAVPAVRSATPGATDAATTRKVAGASTIRLPLRQLIGAKEPIYLPNASSSYQIFVPLSPRYDLRSCKLHLVFANSIALLSERSVLRVVLNQRVIAQYYLTRDQPNHSVDIEVPVKYMEAGSNELQFVVAQHYTLECEDPGAPELWTQIFPDESYFEAVVSWRDVYPKLSLLRDLIDQKLWDPYRFHISIPSGTGGMTDSHLSWGSVICQGAAINLGYRPFAVTTGSQLLAGVDNIVVGTMNELTPYLTSTEIGAINGSFIAFKQLPGDPTHFLLIISGRNEEEVGQAAYAFSLINFPLPDSQYAQIDQISFPDKEFYIKNAPVKDPGLYSFRQLGMEKSGSVKGWNTSTFQVEVYMPGDLSPDDASNVELRLHFVYGAALRRDSVLNILVNQEFQFAIQLNDERGAMHSGHKVYLPVQAFQPGRNVVELAPKMVPLITNHCTMVQIENLWFTLYKDSEFVVPNLNLKARLPNLTVFSQRAFPYSASPDGIDLAVMVAGKDSASVCAAWMLLGKMAQINGSILHRGEISFRLPKSDKNLLVVGPVDTLPDDLMANSPMTPQEIGRVRYLASVSPEPGATALGPVEELLDKLRGSPLQHAEREQASVVTMKMKSELRDDTVAVSFENPFHLGKLATVITAADDKNLYRGLYNLQDRRFWDNLSGNVAVWNTTPRSLATVQVGPEFIYGQDTLISRQVTRFNSNPWLFAGVLFGAIALLAVMLRVMLKRREKPDKQA